MAGNARFHDKQHRKNHHTLPTTGYPDSGNDPIASIEEPFQGDFIINGRLSASSGIDILSAHIAGDVDCENMTVRGTTFTNFISSDSTETIISDGSLVGNGDFTLTMDFGSGIYAKSPILSISNKLSVTGDTDINKNLKVVGNSTLSSVNVNDKVYLDYPTNSLVDSSVGNASLTIREETGVPINMVESGTVDGAVIRGFRARGSTNAKESVSANDVIIGLRGFAYNGVNYNGYGYGGMASINFHAEGDQTPSNGGGYLTFYTNPSSTVNNLQERIRITGSGNVGIGTSTPSEKLHVDGNIYTTGNVFVAGNLSAMGDISYIDTTVLGTSAVTIDNHSIIPALSVKQINGSTIALFNDGTSDVVKIYSSGLSAKNGYFTNKIGVGFSSPTYTVDVNGKIRGIGAQEALIASNGSGDGQTSIIIKREEAADNRKTWELIQYQQSTGLNSGGFAIRTISDNYLSSGECFLATRGNEGVLINSVSLLTNSNTRFHINSSGNIGIGSTTTIPDKYGRRLVHIYDGSLGGLLSLASVSGNSLLWREEASNTFIIDSDRDYNTIERSNNTNIRITTGNEFTIESKPIGSSTIKILSGGNIGLGTNSPITKLHIIGDVMIPSSNFLNFNEISGHTAIKRDGSNNGMEFFTNSASRMFISDSGNIGIGTKTQLHAPPDKLEVSGNVGAYGFRVKQGIPDGNPLPDASTNGYAFGDDGDTGMFSPSAIGALPASVGTIGWFCNNIETARTFLNFQPIFTIGGLSAASETYGRTTLAIGDSNNGGLIELKDGANGYSVIYRDAFTNSLWLNSRTQNSGIVLSATGGGSINFGVSSIPNAIKVNSNGIVDIPKINSTVLVCVTAKNTQSTYVPVSSNLMSGNITLVLSSNTYLFLDTNGSGRTVTLPTITFNNTGLTFNIKNISTLSNSISVNNSSGTLIVELLKDKYAKFIYDGVNWQFIN